MKTITVKKRTNEHWHQFKENKGCPSDTSQCPPTLGYSKMEETTFRLKTTIH